MIVVLNLCAFLLAFTPRDIHRQLWNIQTLSAAVKAWIASTIHGKGAIRADSSEVMVTLINLSYLPGIKKMMSILLWLRAEKLTHIWHITVISFQLHRCPVANLPLALAGPKVCW